MYYSFDVLKLRNDLKELADKTSYRSIESETGGSLKRSKISRLVNGEVIFGLRDAETVINLMGATYDDYIIAYHP